MDQTDYFDKMDALVNNKQTYGQLKCDPVPALLMLFLDNIDAFYDLLNEHYADIQFTLKEIKESRKLSFLDYSVSRDNNGLQTKVFRKNRC